jgi:heme/copper-type cytochrome/quinol oxidase subunit 1
VYILILPSFGIVSIAILTTQQCTLYGNQSLVLAMC